MAKYIDKAVVAAEIKRRINGLKDCHADTVAGYAGEISGLKRILAFIGALEVKEEVTTTDAFIKKAKEAFCKATCNGHPPRRTCTSLGTCKEYDNFVKLLKRE